MISLSRLNFLSVKKCETSLSWVCWMIKYNLVFLSLGSLYLVCIDFFTFYFYCNWLAPLIYFSIEWLLKSSNKRCSPVAALRTWFPKPLNGEINQRGWPVTFYLGIFCETVRVYQLLILLEQDALQGHFWVFTRRAWVSVGIPSREDYKVCQNDLFISI